MPPFRKRRRRRALPSRAPLAPPPNRPEGEAGLAITKADLVEMLHDRIGFSKKEARELVETSLDEIRAALAGGEEVKLSGFGKFELRDKPPRPGRNPKTGEEVTISARRVVNFRPSQVLKSRVNDEG
jgi:integration host factor subunit alpha